ncbi:ATP-binding protein [Planctomycetota bacterium]
MVMPVFGNPFKPGAGHMPPFLAGRNNETQEFCKLLQQDVILENLVLTGLRGVGKTVLLDTFKPLALNEKWVWAGTDLSESVSLNEETIALRLLTDLSMVTSGFIFKTEEIQAMGFNTKEFIIEKTLSYSVLTGIFKAIPGLLSDKLKGVLEFVWSCIKPQGVRGIIFAYDEAQTMSDHVPKGQYPLSLLLDTFQSIQRKSIPFMLVLTGLPTLFPKLVDARTFSERMFKVTFLDSLNREDSKEAVMVPIQDANCPVHFTSAGIDAIIEKSGGYPYFIQFICKESFDMYLQQMSIISEPYIDYKKAITEITRKLDNDFFAGRWAKATDRQRELLTVIAGLDNGDEEFTVQEIVENAKKLERPFSSSHVNQMLSTLTNMGLVYKNRHGKYSFAVPLLGQYILRQQPAYDKKQQKNLFDDLK